LPANGLKMTNALTAAMRMTAMSTVLIKTGRDNFMKE
jgi:hypothetical protein